MTLDEAYTALKTCAKCNNTGRVSVLIGVRGGRKQEPVFRETTCPECVRWRALATFMLYICERIK